MGFLDFLFGGSSQGANPPPDPSQAPQPTQGEGSLLNTLGSVAPKPVVDGPQTKSVFTSGLLPPPKPSPQITAKPTGLPRVPVAPDTSMYDQNTPMRLLNDVLEGAVKAPLDLLGAAPATGHDELLDLAKQTSAGGNKKLAQQYLDQYQQERQQSSLTDGVLGRPTATTVADQLYPDGKITQLFRSIVKSTPGFIAQTAVTGAEGLAEEAGANLLPKTAGPIAKALGKSAITSGVLAPVLSAFQSNTPGEFATNAAKDFATLFPTIIAGTAGSALIKKGANAIMDLASTASKQGVTVTPEVLTHYLDGDTSNESIDKVWNGLPSESKFTFLQSHIGENRLLSLKRSSGLEGPTGLGESRLAKLTGPEVPGEPPSSDAEPQKGQEGPLPEDSTPSLGESQENSTQPGDKTMVQNGGAPAGSQLRLPLEEPEVNTPGRDQYLQDKAQKSAELDLPNAKADEIAAKNPDLPSPKDIVTEGPTPIKQRGRLLDSVGTPEIVGKRMGFEPLFDQFYKNQTQFYTEAREMQGQVKNWIDQAKTAGLTKADTEDLSRYVNGEKSINLSKTAQKIADEMKVGYKDFLKRGHIQSTIEDYFPQRWEPGTGKSPGFPEDIAKTIEDQIPSSVYHKNLLARKGNAGGYILDPFKAYQGYAKTMLRKINMDPILTEMSSAAEKSEITVRDYMKDFLDSYNYRPSKLDGLIDNQIKASPIGTRLGDRPTALLGRMSRNLSKRAALWFDTMTALKHLPMFGNVVGELKPKYTMIGLGKMVANVSNGFADMDAAGVRNTNFSTMEYSAKGTISKLLSKADSIGFAALNTAMGTLKGIAFYGAKERALDGGASLEEALQQGAKAVRTSLFSFDRADMPTLFRSEAAKSLFQFHTITLKQMEYLANAGREGDWAKLFYWTLTTSGIIAGLSKTFGIAPTKLIPGLNLLSGGSTNPIGSKLGELNPPPLEVPEDVLSSALNLPDKYGQTQKGGILQRIATNPDIKGDTLATIVPGGLQGERTVQGIKALQTGGVKSKSGKSTNYNVKPTLFNKIVAPTLGVGSTTEGQEYNAQYGNGMDKFILHALGKGKQSAPSSGGGQGSLLNDLKLPQGSSLGSLGDLGLGNVGDLGLGNLNLK